MFKKSNKEKTINLYWRSLLKDPIPYQVISTK